MWFLLDRVADDSGSGTDRMIALASSITPFNGVCTEVYGSRSQALFYSQFLYRCTWKTTAHDGSFSKSHYFVCTDPHVESIAGGIQSCGLRACLCYVTRLWGQNDESGIQTKQNSRDVFNLVGNQINVLKIIQICPSLS